MLTLEQTASYKERGYLAPLEGLSTAEVHACQRSLHDFLQSSTWPLDRGLQHKPHLYLRWVSDLAHHPSVLNVVEDLLGPNLLIWRSAFFIKQPHDAGFTAWHQDAEYWGLDSEDVVTAWIALTDSTIENGCLRVVAGSHKWGRVPHRIKPQSHNALLRRQYAEMEIPDQQVAEVELRAGQFSLHHVNILHGSKPNSSDSPRAGLAIRYLATSVQQKRGRQSATLVRGEDRYGHFDLEPVPAHDYDPIALRVHARSVRRYAFEVAWETVSKPSLTNLNMLCRIILNRRSLALVRTMYCRLAKHHRPQEAP